MAYEKLDNDELLRLALDAMQSSRDADSLTLLKTLLERVPGHPQAAYLLAAQHAQLGLYDRAEAGFRQAVQAAPEMQVARFQLGQLLVLRGAADDARETLLPLAAGGDALAAYARALTAVVLGEPELAVRELDTGLALPQDVPVLAQDMQRLRERLASHDPESDRAPAEIRPVAMETPSAHALYLAGYGRSER